MALSNEAAQRLVQEMIGLLKEGGWMAESDELDTRIEGWLTSAEYPKIADQAASTGAGSLRFVIEIGEKVEIFDIDAEEFASWLNANAGRTIQSVILRGGVLHIRLRATPAPVPESRKDPYTYCQDISPAGMPCSLGAAHVGSHRYTDMPVPESQPKLKLSADLIYEVDENGKISAVPESVGEKCPTCGLIAPLATRDGRHIWANHDCKSGSQCPSSGEFLRIGDRAPSQPSAAEERAK